MEQPISDEYRNQMNKLADALNLMLNPKGEQEVGFALLMFEFGVAKDINYISNADRSDVKAALRELLARWEGRMVEPTVRVQ